MTETELDRKLTRHSADQFLLLFYPLCPRSLLRLRNLSSLQKMFKRVEKKLAKKKKDEELGFSEEIKEAIGLIDSDSDDSSSDESEASSSTSNLQVPSKRKQLLDDELDAGSDANSEGKGSGAADDSEDYEDEPGVQMSVEEALHDPLYIISIQPDIRGCIICPRKLLKNNTMASVHMKSQVCHFHSTSRYGDLMTCFSSAS